MEVTIMKFFIGAFILVSISGNAYAQKCLHKNLSKTFDYELTATHIAQPPGTVDSADIVLRIKNKKSGKLQQKISLGVNYIYPDVFKNCGNNRSYITGYNENREVSDYDFGDLIVADLNFDGKEDFAIKFDSGGNGWPLYNFYLQDSTGHFSLSKYLTEQVMSFPQEIDPAKKTITTQIHSNAYREARSTFKYNPKTKTWRFIRSKLV